MVRHQKLISDGHAVLLGPAAEGAKHLMNFWAREEKKTLVGVECDKVERSYSGKDQIEARWATWIRAALVGHE
jgi:hypothetical protein